MVTKLDYIIITQRRIRQCTMNEHLGATQVYIDNFRKLYPDDKEVAEQLQQEWAKVYEYINLIK